MVNTVTQTVKGGPAGKQSRLRRLAAWLRRDWPGLAACAVAVPAAFALHLLMPAVPVMTLAVIMGVLAWP
jgi:hypothetical protein